MSRKSRKSVNPTIKETTGIGLQVPNILYFHIKGKADKDTLNNQEKKTIHDKMIEQLWAANPDCPREDE